MEQTAAECNTERQGRLKPLRINPMTEEGEEKNRPGGGYVGFGPPRSRQNNISSEASNRRPLLDAFPAAFLLLKEGLDPLCLREAF